MKIEELQDLAERVLQQAKQQGASDAEVLISRSQGLSLNTRLCQLENIEYIQDQSLNLIVYLGQRKASISCSDFSPTALEESVRKACTIAAQLQEDPHQGLAPAELMAKEIPDLNLYHPWSLSIEEAEKICQSMEQAALDHDACIKNSEGAQLFSQNSLSLQANTQGFSGAYQRSSHYLSCTVIAQDGEQMQRDYWYDSRRDWRDLSQPEAIGRQAAQRALARLHPRSMPAGEMPVIFAAEVARSLLAHCMAAINGTAQYQQRSFLLNQLGQKIFPDWVQISDQPHLPKGLGSRPFDGNGLATRPHHYVQDGILQHYLLDIYAARRLGMTANGTAGGPFNLRIESSGQSLDELLKMMGRGLLVTELMGMGTNEVTGDYSQGASGFWVDEGQIQYPVEGITVAGNLKQIYADLLAVGNDALPHSATQTGSWLIAQMTVAAN